MKEFNVPIYFVTAEAWLIVFYACISQKSIFDRKTCEAKNKVRSSDCEIYHDSKTWIAREWNGLFTIEGSKDINEILYAEAIAAKTYFDQWSLHADIIGRGDMEEV